MTKLTALDIYVLIDTLLHSLAQGEYWTGSATEKSRDDMLVKLQQIMNQIENEVGNGI